MATTAATLAIKVTADTAQAARGLDATSSSASKFQTGIDKAAKVAAGAGIALAAFGTASFNAASEAQQAAGAVDAAFGPAAKAIHKFATTSADSVGLASSEYEAMAAVFGSQLKNMGVASKDLAPMTNDLVGLGADLAAQFGGSTSDAVAALSSLLRGETDPIERYGVSIKQADIEAQKAAMGLDGLEGKADKAATTQATLALLTKQTAKAHGAFAREADTAAGQQARASAAWKDAQIALGQVLLPVVSKAAELFGSLSSFVKENAAAFQIAAGAVGILTAAILAIKAGMIAWNAVQMAAKVATTAWTAAQWLLNAALTANPIGLVVAAVAALIAGLVLAYKKSDKFRAIVQAVGRAAATVFKAIVRAIQVAIKWIVNIVKVVAKRLGPALTAMKKVAVFAFKAYTLPIRLVIKILTTLVKIIAKVLPAAFRTASSVVKTVLSAVRTAIGWVIDKVQSLVDKVRTAAAAIRTAIGWVIDKVGALIGWIRDRLGDAWRATREVARTVFDAIRTPIQWVIDKIGRLIEKVRSGLGDAWRATREVARTVFDAIRTPIQWVIDKVQKLVDKLSDALEPAFDAVETTATTAFDLMLTPINAVRDAIQWVIDKVESLIGWIDNISFPEPPGWMKAAGGFLGSIMPGMAPAPPATAPTVHAGARGAGRTSSAGNGGITINVTGALDPDAVARQIQRILIGRSRRVGGIARTAGAA